MKKVLFMALIFLVLNSVGYGQDKAPKKPEAPAEIQLLDKQIRETTAALHEKARELAEMRARLVAAELKSLEAKTMTPEQYLNAEANSIAASDVETALLHVRWAWNDDGPCTRFFLCWTYFDGAGIKFQDGTFGPFVQIYRDGKSAHSCIQSALDALNESPPNRGVAVEWVMASQIHNRPVFDWLQNHPDAVVAALRQIH